MIDDSYNDVAARIREFREKYPEGCLQPANPLEPYKIERVGDKTFVTFCAAAFRSPEDPRPGIGTAWEPVPGPTNFTRDSELQNAETSAWGRALIAVLAADSKKGIASADEIQSRQATPSTAPSQPSSEPITERQKNAIFAISRRKGIPMPERDSMTKAQAGAWIESHGDAA